MKIVVCSRGMAKRTVLDYLKSYSKIAVISICDTDRENPHFISGVKVCNLQFDDVDSGENCMTESDALKICDFVNFITLHNYDVLIVHCEAGISRSSGVAAAIMKYIYNDDWEIFNNKLYYPNMFCYKLVLETFNEINRT